jgi:hypothetical protein
MENDSVVKKKFGGKTGARRQYSRALFSGI